MANADRLPVATCSRYLAEYSGCGKWQWPQAEEYYPWHNVSPVTPLAILPAGPGAVSGAEDSG